MEKYIFYIHNSEILFKEYYKTVDLNNKYYSMFQTIIPNVTNFGLDLIKFLEIICSQTFSVRKKIILNMEYTEFNALFNDSKCFEYNSPGSVALFYRIKIDNERSLEIYNLHNLISCAEEVDKNFGENFSSFLVKNNLRIENIGSDTWIVSKTNFWKFNFIKIIFRENNDYIENIILESKSLSILQIKQVAIKEFKNIDYGLENLVTEIEAFYSTKDDNDNNIRKSKKRNSISKFDEEFDTLHSPIF
jgi:hypothetical protein